MTSLLRNNFYLTIFLTQLSLSAWGQNANINGNIVDNNHKPIPFLSIGLCKSKDSTILKGSLSDSLGNFEFKRIDKGLYLLSVSGINYQQLYIKTIEVSDSLQKISVGEIAVFEAVKQLNEVTVTGKKPFIERKIDRLIANIDGSILAQGNNGLEVLGKLPYLKTSPNGTLILNGSGDVLVIIDGIGNRQSVTQTISLLKSMQAENIEKVEIYTNPPAKFDAQGAGVVNVITKKEKSFSDLYSSYEQRIYPTSDISGFNYNSFNFGSNLNFSTGKWKLKSNINFSRLNLNYEKSTIETVYKNSIRESSNETDPLPSYMMQGSVTIGYTIDTLNELLFRFNVSKDKVMSELSQLSQIRNSVNNIGIANSIMNQIFKYYDNSIVLTYKHIFARKSSSKISFDYNYGSFDFDNLLEISRIELQKSIFQNQLYSSIYNVIKTDFSTVKKKINLETGLKYTSIISDDNYQQIEIPNTFNYSEKIGAFYIRAERSYTKFSFQAGLRAEYTYSRGESSLDLNKSTKRDYFSLFPSLFLQYSFTDENQINFSANRRIIRPDYSVFNPYNSVSSFDSYSTTRGNISIIPQFVYRYELSSTIKNLNISLAYTYNKNEKTNIASDRGNNIFYQEATNIDSNNWILSLNKSLNLSSFWETNCSININNYSSLILLQTPRAWSFDIGSNHQIKISKKSSAEMSINYYSLQKLNYWQIGERLLINIGFNTKLVKNKLSLNFDIENILGSGRLTWISDYGDVMNTSKELTNTRQFKIGLNYKFKTSNKFDLRNRKINEGELRH